MALKTLVYSPKVEAFVLTESGKIIDLSKDIASGTVKRITDGVSSATLVLNNRNARYNGVLSRMDRIHIRFFKGSKQYPVFTGYITTVPVFNAYVTTAVIECQDTLKQILHTYWDKSYEKNVEKFIVKRQPLRQPKVDFSTLMLSSQDPVTGETSNIQVVGTEDQKRLVEFAMSKKMAYNYVLGGGRPNPDATGSTDCSGFTSYCYRKVLNIDIGYDSRAQRAGGTMVASGGRGVEPDYSKLQPGDIMANYWTSGTSHVELYVGDGKLLTHGGPGRGPQLVTFKSQVGSFSSWVFKRYVKTSASSSAGTMSAPAPMNVTNTSSTTFGAPISGTLTVNSNFGYRVNPVSGVRSMHNGVDLQASCGTRQYAIADGTVTKNYYDSGGGNMIVINHGSVGGVSWQSEHLHLQSRSPIAAGKFVKKGQEIGRTGTTGSSTGCHVHLGMKRNGAYVNPMSYINKATAPTGGGGGSNTGRAIDNYVFDPRTSYFEQQAADGLNGVRLKGFLNEVCGWNYSNILIETVPDKIVSMAKTFGITEGASDPEDSIQDIYRMIMGDTFSSNSEQSRSSTSNSGFSGTEGKGDQIYSATMYGIAKTISNINYTATRSQLKYANFGDRAGAYGLPSMSGKPKSTQDTAMLTLLKSYVAMGTTKTTASLAARYISALASAAPTGTISIASRTRFTSSVVSASKSAPKPNSVSSSTGHAQSTSTSSTVSNSAIELYLKGLRETESSNNYKAPPNPWNCSGAYQYKTNVSWINYGGYYHAYQAPPEVQDRKAREDTIKSWNRFKDWKKVAINHIYPIWANRPEKWDTPISAYDPTPNEYAKRVLRYMNGDETLDSNSSGGGQSLEQLGELIDQSFYSFFKQVNFNNAYISEESSLLSGEKALMNDTSAMDFVKTLCKGSLRSFQSDPFGNFVAFFPDYFGMYKSDSSKNLHRIQDVELIDVTIRATDDIYTHVYIIDSAQVPDLYGLIDTSTVSETFKKLNSTGVVTFENTDLIRTLLNFQSDAEVNKFLRRHGARPYVENRPEITNKQFAKLYAIQVFLQRWAGQFNTQVQLTFSPELWPGNRAIIGSTGVAVYIDSVTHQFSYTGGFKTTAVVSSPQQIGKSVAPSLPNGL